MLTMITQVFGVQGDAGNLILYPKLLACQFDKDGIATITTSFAGKKLTITYVNKNFKDFGNYTIVSAVCDTKSIPVSEDSYLVLPKKSLSRMSDKPHKVTVTLA